MRSDTGEGGRRLRNRSSATAGRVFPAAKISTPDSSGALARTRLFSVLDSCRRKPVIWVSGPAGGGKTTLVASWLEARGLPCLWYQVDEGDCDIASFFYYIGMAAKKAAPRQKRLMPLLTPEYQQGVPVFAMRYFEELFRRLKPPFAIVFDNFQDAASSVFHEVIGRAMETIPEGMNVIVLSRTGPPDRLVRLRAGDRIGFLGWNDLRFTFQECIGFLKTKVAAPLPGETVRQLHERTDGWAAGLILMTEMAKMKDVDYSRISELSREAIFAYFASEIFGKADRETSDFLLRTSFLPWMTASAAEELTGNPGARELLMHLSRNHYFTDWRQLPKPLFQYHPLFRDFLKSRAADVFGPADLRDLQLRTAAVLEATGQIEEAAEFFARMGEADGLSRLVLAHAAGLTSQGRFGIVAGWLEKIPQDRTGSDQWLLYWKGLCRLLAGLLVGARSCFEEAFRLCNEKGDDGGALLSWSGVVETIVYTWDDFKPLDRWIEWLEAREQRGLLGRGAPAARAAASMVMALYFRKFGDPARETWIEKAISLARETGDAGLMIQAHLNAVWYFLYTDVPRCRVMLDEAKNMVGSAGSPFVKINLKGLEAVIHSSFPGWGEDAVGDILEVRELSRNQGIFFYDHILLPQAAFAFLNRGETALLPELLEKIRSAIPPHMRNLQACYHMLAGWERLIAGDVRLAAAHGRTSLDFSRESGSPCAEAMSLILCAQALHEAGEREESLRQVGLVRLLSEEAGNHLLLYLSLLMEALFALDRGDGRLHRELLSRAMTFGRRKGLATILFWWNRPGMARLCEEAIEAGIEVDHVQRLVRTLGLVPGRPVGNWPYPVRIHTLGKFEVLLEDRPMLFPGKVQKKPLEMLKALVAFGADISERRLADVLWPDAEGDAAHKSFEMTLLRLRRLLGREDSVFLQGGALSLNPGICRVDVQVFEDLARKAIVEWEKTVTGRRQGEEEKAVRLSERALEMYRGPFLPNDSDLDCTAGMRERLRNLALQLTGSLGGHWEAKRQWQKAIGCYRKGIETDRLCEDFYRRLMICCESQGENAEALRVYERCRSVLSSELGIEPSPKTQEVYDRIRRR